MIKYQIQTDNWKRPLAVEELDCLRQKLSFSEQKVKEKEEQNKEM